MIGGNSLINKENVSGVKSLDCNTKRKRNIADLNRKELAFQIIKTLILLIGALIMVLPFWWMILSSFKSPAELLRLPPTWFPQEFTLENYKKVLDMMPFWGHLLNSIFVATLNTIIALFTSSIIGYVFAKYEFKGKNILFFIIISTLIIPYQILMIPLFTLMIEFGWIDSYLVLTIPYFVNIFGIFLMRQFMISVPDELIDAARIDGCSHFTTFFRIVLPVVKPSLATLSIFFFMENWNSYLWPLIAINSKKYMTLPIGLGTFVSQHFGRYDLLMAASLMAILPMIVVFFIAQKKFIEGIALTGMKG